MAVKDNLYDALAYAGQVEGAAKSHRKEIKKPCCSSSIQKIRKIQTISIKKNPMAMQKHSHGIS